MRVVCTVSHEEPQEGGGFRRFEAGQEYEGDFENPYFEKVEEAGADFKPAPAGKKNKEVTGNDN